MAFRLARSGLIEPFDSQEAAARALIGAQAQFVPSAGLTLWNRTNGLTHAALDDALYERRTLVKLWGQRGTLHLYVPEDWPLIHAAFRTRRSWAAGAAARFGGDVDALEAVIARVGAWMRHGEPTTRADLVGRWEELDRWLRLGNGPFMDLAQAGVVCHARPLGSKARFTHREAWVPDVAWDPPDRDVAGVRLTRRYLGRYGPATYRDVGFWLGVPAGDAKRWVAALAGESVEVETEDGMATVLGEDLDALLSPEPALASVRPRLLHRFDALLLAHRDKGWVIDADRYKAVWRKAGYVEAVVLIGGRVGGTWRYDRRGTRLTVRLEPFDTLSRATKRELEQEASGVAGFFGLSLDGFQVS